MKNKNSKVYFVTFLFIMSILLLWRIGAFRFISIENLKNLKSWIDSFGQLGPLVYILLYIFACLFFLPGLPLTVLGGVIFGPVKGTIYTVIGAGIGLSLAFLAARYTFRGLIEKKFGDSPLFKKLDEGVKKQGWRILITTRLIPIFPFNVQNYVYGLTSISFLQYSVLSTIFIIPGTSAYTFSAGAIASGEGFSPRNLTYLGIGAFFFILVSLLPKLIKKWNNPKKDR
jgi:uncharacterized membrane protein YdjX (TVP38/TMEM64 family)